MNLGQTGIIDTANGPSPPDAIESAAPGAFLFGWSLVLWYEHSGTKWFDVLNSMFTDQHNYPVLALDEDVVLIHTNQRSRENIRFSREMDLKPLVLVSGKERSSRRPPFFWSLRFHIFVRHIEAFLNLILKKPAHRLGNSVRDGQEEGQAVSRPHMLCGQSM